MQTDAAAAFAAAQAQYKQTFEKHLANGVNFMSDQVWIDPEVEIAPGATILPGCILRGNTKIGAGCVVGPKALLNKVNRAWPLAQLIDAVAAEHAANA